MTAKLVECLAEMEERRLHLLAGFPSMFEFCTKQPKMSEGEAFRRILAARLGKRFPVVHALLASGAVHLSALALLRDYLTEENHAELLEAVSGKSNRDVQLLLARRFPQPDSPSRIAPARIEPLSERRFRVEFTAGASLVEKLELCRDLMSHANPAGDLAVVVERALDLLLADLQTKRLSRKKRGAARERKASDPRTSQTPSGAKSSTATGSTAPTSRPTASAVAREPFWSSITSNRVPSAAPTTPRTCASSAERTTSSTRSKPSAASTSNGTVTCASTSAARVPPLGRRLSKP